MRRKNYPKVKQFDSNFAFDSVKSTFEKASNFRSKSKPGYSYKMYVLSQHLSKLKPMLFIILPVFITIIGLFIIDAGFKPIQTPNEIYGRLQNLNLMCAMLVMIIMWLDNLRANKVPIFR